MYRLRCQPNPARTKGKLLKVSELFFVDDGAFLFSNREDLQKGVEAIHKHFVRFGQIMHIGKINEDNTRMKSKTVAMYFPATRKESETDALQCIKYSEYYVLFVKQFTYLGSIIATDLRDDYEVNRWLKVAMNQMAAVMNVFRSHVDI